LVRIITHQNATALIEALKNAGVMITSVDAAGSLNSVKIIFSVVKRRRYKEIVEIVERFDADAFYSVEDVKYNSRDVSGLSTFAQGGAFDRLLRVRKSV